VRKSTRSKQDSKKDAAVKGGKKKAKGGKESASPKTAGLKGGVQLVLNGKSGGIPTYRCEEGVRPNRGGGGPFRKKPVPKGR